MKQIVHVVPTSDVSTNHRSHSDCPCCPERKHQKAFGKDSIVYIHKYMDAHAEVKLLCKSIGVDLPKPQFKSIIVK